MRATPLFVAVLVSALGYAQNTEVRILVQNSPLAGFQYFQGKQLWDSLKVGDMLTRVREPDNPHDGNAIRVERQGPKLGYIPRRENGTVALHMDRGGLLQAHVSRLTAHRNPWQRIAFEVHVKL